MMDLPLIAMLLLQLSPNAKAGRQKIDSEAGRRKIDSEDHKCFVFNWGKREVIQQDDFDQALPRNEYDDELASLDMDAVKQDMAKLLKNSNDCWPADTGFGGPGNYAGLMIRLAWHCSGSYRQADGVGGCTGGRLRFEPERSWEDNANLDKAMALLVPLKRKYGPGLSWGDLMVLAGTTAYREAGAPIKRMCFGRVDESNGQEARLLGPTAVQEANFPCERERCEHPLPMQVGLIYVNPGTRDPFQSASDIKRTFTTMGHSDRSTVALVGGGHAIGKCHGACAGGSPGLPPNEAFERGGVLIYQGTCGTGIGRDTVTSGFEGYWTTEPFKWDNEFFRYLLDFEWELTEAPTGNPQWMLKERTIKKHSDSDRAGKIIRLTSDIALLYDREYKFWVKEFAENMTKLNEAFDFAWDLLTTNGVGEWSKNAKCDDGSAPPTTRTRMRADDVVFDAKPYYR